MTTHLMEGLKVSDFITKATLEPKNGAKPRIVSVQVDDRAACRQSIILSLRKLGVEFKTRSDWNAGPARNSDGADWGYKRIVLHHSGNSFTCSAPGVTQMKRLEAIDVRSFGHVSYHYAIDCNGVIYEALDIREKGAHLEGANTGSIGIVMLQDLSVHGEASDHGPGIWNRTKQGAARAKGGIASKIVAGARSWGKELFTVVGDAADVHQDDAPEIQIKALYTLVKVLRGHFDITTFGGHREYAVLKGADHSRACPGAYGMILSNMVRREFGLLPPGMSKS